MPLLSVAEGLAAKADVPHTIGNWGIFLCFVAIGVLQTVLAYEAGVLAVKALPKEAIDAPTQKRYIRFFVALGVALCLLTVTIGWFNDRTQQESDLLAHKTSDDVEAVSVDVRSIAQAIKTSVTPLLNQKVFEGLPKDVQTSTLRLHKEAEDLVALASKTRTNIQSPPTASTRPQAVTSPRQQPAPPVVQPQSTSSGVRNDQYAVASVAPPNTSEPAVSSTTNQPPSSNTPVASPAPTAFIQLEKLGIDSANRRHPWNFIAWLNDNYICDAHDVASSDSGDQFDLTKVCKPYPLPQTGTWSLSAQVDGVGGKSRLLNCEGVIIGRALDIAHESKQTHCIMAGDAQFRLTFSVVRQ